MLEALVIFNQGGLVLYQYNANPSLVDAEDGPQHTRSMLNTVIRKIMLQSSLKTFHIEDRLSFCWQSSDDKILVAVYPDIMFEGPRQYLRQWAGILLQRTASAYQTYSNGVDGPDTDLYPDPQPFDKVFLEILSSSKTEKQHQAPASTVDAAVEAATGGADNNKGKEKRQWHDGKAAVTKEAMAALDKSGAEVGNAEAAAERALQEARQAYLPSEQDLSEAKLEDESTQASSSWSDSVTGLLQQLTGNKKLSDDDLAKPLAAMKELLMRKNVAAEIADGICEQVQAQLRGKKLNTLYRVQTAVEQGTEKVIRGLLSRDIDLLRAVLTKRGDGSFFSSQRQPYVICVMGINGIGKTTSLAKLAYYFKENGCRPMLVAGDTFRSGAVEQLKVHADCLQVDLFSEGYSKDPSSVAKSAIAKATENGNDVVLIDTAGRMQNNVPLMTALGKLVSDNRPDCVLMVCEALVGHDGLSQFKMFQQALGKRPIDGLLLTKYDTVGDKVGAALTLTHETLSPVVFCGTGQKYHHLKKLNVAGVIQSLFC